MGNVVVDKRKLLDTIQQLKVLYASHDKNLEKLKYNLPMKMGLTSEMKKIRKLLKYYEDLNLL